MYFTFLCTAWGVTFCVIIAVSRVTSSCMLLHEKTVLEIWLSPGLSLTIFKEPGPDVFFYSYLFISKP